MSLFLFFCLVSVIFAGFSGGYSKTGTAEQGFCCVFTKRHKTPTKAFRFLSLQVCWYDVVQCAVMWWVVMMKPHALGLLPDRVQLWVSPDPGVSRSGWGMCACMCWRPVKGQRSQAGSVSDGCKSWNSREKKNTQLVEYVCQINETNTNKTSRTFNTT